MGKGWSKGLNKENNYSIRKRSITMRKYGIDNFAVWREKVRKEGKFGSDGPLKKDGDLAELIGVVLGDGHIRKFPRTEELSIFSNANNPGFVRRYGKLVEKIFGKNPTCRRHGKNLNCIRIRIYQNNIQHRLGVPYSPRGKLTIHVPRWISINRDFIIRYLRGLYEAEGCFCVHKPTCTYKMFFSNCNESMLRNVYILVKKLGFHPHRSLNQVQISKMKEVYVFKKLIEFRKY